MTLRELLERRSAVVTEMRAITAAPGGEGGDLSAEQAKKFDEFKTELSGIEKRIERQQLLDDAERRMEGTPLTSGDQKFDAELRKYSLVRAIASQVPDLAGRIDAGREREISAELTKRTGMQFQGVPVPLQVFEKRVTTSGGAGDLIATDLMSGQFIDSLRNALVIRRLGARVLSGLVGDVDIPKRGSSASAYWVAENSAVTPSDFTTDKVSLTPKTVGAITEFSRKLLLQSTPDVEALVRDDFAQVLARAVDLAAIQGGGSNEPVGLLASAIDTTTDLSASIFSGGYGWSHLLELIEKVDLANAEGSAFLTDPSVVRKLRSAPLVPGYSVLMESPSMLAGYPCLRTNAMPADSSDDHVLMFGNWSDLLIGYWSVFDLLVNPYESTAYAKGNIQVRGLITCDVAIRHLESFAASINVDTTSIALS